MKILIVCSGNHQKENFDFLINQSFVYEQIESLKNFEIDYDTYFIKGRGVFGYLKNVIPLISKINSYKPDIVHAHYGLSGLLVSLQNKVPVIITFHGSDTNDDKINYLSKIGAKLASVCIFVNHKQKLKMNFRGKVLIIPCGVNMEVFFPINKMNARRLLELDKEKLYILFPSRFDNRIKNYSLAKKVTDMLEQDVVLVELDGYSRSDVNLLLNAVDLLLFTSISEGSPQVVKEAMACNCPIVSVDVGDVRGIIENVNGCIISSYKVEDIVKNIEKVLMQNMRTNGRKFIKRYDLNKIAKKISVVYREVAKR